MTRVNSIDSPAFPCKIDSVNEQGHDGVFRPHSGMTLRDYFAAKANPNEIYDGNEGIPVKLAKALMGGDWPSFEDDPIASAKWWAEALAKWKYMFADAMLTAREVKP